MRDVFRVVLTFVFLQTVVSIGAAELTVFVLTSLEDAGDA